MMWSGVLSSRLKCKHRRNRLLYRCQLRRAKQFRTSVQMEPRSFLGSGAGMWRGTWQWRTRLLLPTCHTRLFLRGRRQSEQRNSRTQNMTTSQKTISLCPWPARYLVCGAQRPSIFCRIWEAVLRWAQARSASRCFYFNAFRLRSRKAMQHAWWAHSRWYKHPTSAPTTRVLYFFVIWFHFIIFHWWFYPFLYILRAGPVGIKK